MRPPRESESLLPEQPRRWTRLEGCVGFSRPGPSCACYRSIAAGLDSGRAISRMQGDMRGRWSGRRLFAKGALPRTVGRLDGAAGELRDESGGKGARATLTSFYTFVARPHTPDGFLHGKMRAPRDVCHIHNVHEVVHVSSHHIAESPQKHGLPGRLAFSPLGPLRQTTLSSNVVV